MLTQADPPPIRDTLNDLMKTLLFGLLSFLRAILQPRTTLALENAALRQQLAVYQRSQRHVRLRSEDRLFWVLLRRLWSGWDRTLIVVRPETVIAWHRRGFKLFWRRKSGPSVGRPRIPRSHIRYIQRISGDHPEWGEDRIVEELAAKFGVTHSSSTIRRYMVPRERPPRAKHTWRTFIRNHTGQVWACDFLTQYTAFYAVIHVFVIMEVGSRRIVHANVTSNPTLSWVKQQFREATAENEVPRFLVHDNGGIYRQWGKPLVVEEEGRRRNYRCELDLWLDQVMGIEGLPIPYGAPNASPHIERFMRTVRQEALDHFIFLGASHIRRVVNEYVRYYNGARPSQAIHGIPHPYPELLRPPPTAGELVALPVLGGVQHDYRLVA